jgi:pyruvate,water dikinase
MKQKDKALILWFKDISKKDSPLVGGKNSSLGEMFSQLIKKGINIPDGFVSTSKAYWYFLKENKIDKRLEEIFKKFNPKSLKSLKETGKASREIILKSELPKDLREEIIRSYNKLSRKYGQKNTDVAVRSSATAEDLKTASFAGQHETFLNVRGEKELLKAVKKCIASLFTDRSISYREEKGFKHLKIALSVGVQKMVRSDLASSGVIFTLDTETGFKDVVLINSIFGIGEMIVKGRITPDEFYVFKPTLKKGYKPIIIKNLGRKTKKYVYKKGGGLKELTVPLKERQRFSLTDREVLTLAKWACQIEEYYEYAQDIEWAKDGITNKLFIVQSRPETVHAVRKGNSYEEYEIKVKKTPVLTGIPIGNKIGRGRVRVIPNVSKIGQFQEGEILVTNMTDPDWVPIMEMASAIITNEGGKTAHAAIISRELGIPCIV